MSAHVIVTLKVDVAVGSWNEGASFVSLREQVAREAVTALENALKDRSKFTVMEKPVATMIVLGANHVE